MDWLNRLLGGKGGPPPDEPPDEPSAEAEEIRRAEHDLLVEQMINEGFHARTTFWERLGEVDPYLLAPSLNPGLMGGPRWPALRESWRVVRRPSSTLFASDGLSDPFDDDLTPLGFRLEVCAEADEPLTDDLEVRSSWVFDLVYQASQAVAGAGGIYQAIEDGLVVTTVFRIPRAPEPLKDPEGRTGVIIGFPSRDLPREMELPQGRVLLLFVKPLLPSELAYIENAEDGQAARRQLIDLLSRQPRAHFATADREAVV